MRLPCIDWTFYFRRELWNAFYYLSRETIQATLTFHLDLSDFTQEPITFKLIWPNGTLIEGLVC